ncbi:MAG: methyltransferase domain-containing protein [Actinobacteria bacterium]|nr:methyltransferase domain-containing protein [Actinomycetota bacterium]
MEPTDAVRDHHDLPAPNHHASHPGFSGMSGLVRAVAFLFGRDHAAQLAIELSGLQPGERVVDVGCGPGVAARRARDLGADVIGVDPATVMLRVARLRRPAGRGIQWRIGSAESLPVDDDWAQVMWSLSTVHHWADVDRSLDEAARVLTPGGRLVVLERRIADTEAAGVASHGWTPEQSESFAEHCRRHGFTDVVVGSHAGETTVLSVVAHRDGQIGSSSRRRT